MRTPARWVFISFLLFFLPFAIQAQVTNKDRITLNLKNVTVTDLLTELHNITGLTFNYGDEIKKSDKHFDVHVTEQPIDVVLRNVLLPNGFNYTTDGSVITITPVHFTDGSHVSVHQIRGRVTDDTGEPIVGATIQVPGTKIATISDFNGFFTVNLPDLLHPQVSVSYIGMLSQTVNVKGKNFLTIRMHDDKQTLDDVVVTGYQNIRKSDMVGSNSTIKGKDLDMLGTKSLEQMLQGKLAGTVVTNTSGVVGQRQKVRVRGTSTLLGSQEPVWVVDGIIQTDPLPFKATELNSLGDISQDNMDMIRNFVGSAVSWLNPNDIESVTVLKDASATVLYGVKAANGVIVITTKKGTKGRMSVSYSGGLTIGERITYDRLNLMNSRERDDVSREIYERRLVGTKSLEPIGYEGLLSQYLNKEITYDEFHAAAQKLDTNNTDWLKILFRNPVSHNHSVSLSGGNDQVNYFASLYGNFNNGTQRQNKSDRYGASLRLDAYLAKNVEASASVSGSFAKTYGVYNVDPYSYATTTSRVIPAYNEDGSLFYYPRSAFDYKYNVLNEIENSGNVNEQRSFNASARVQWDIIKGLRLESTLGLSTSNVTGHTYASEHTYAMTQMRGYEYGAYTPNDDEYKASALPHGGQYNYSENHSLSYSWTNQLGYNTVLGKDHRLSFLVGMEIRSEKYDGNGYTRFGYMPDRGETFTQPPLTITTATGTYANTRVYNSTTNTITDRKTNYIGYYGSASYSYQERYTATASIRADASNKFGQDTRNRFLPVWSLGVRWNAINEPWMQKQKALSELDLRLTYGWQGNVAENYGPDLIAQIPTSSPIDTRTGEYILKIRSLAYPDLRWEKTSTWNVGLDLGFWHNRIQFSFEYYYKYTKDMITDKTVPEEYGVETTPVNGGEMENKGLEFTLSTTLIQTKKFNWTLSLNSSKNWNSVESTINENKNWRTAVSGALNKKGYPVQSIWAFRFKDINQTNGDPEFYVPTSDENPAAVNDATAYMEWMGSLEPSFTGGLSTSLRYTNWVLSASFNLNIGDKRFLSPMFADNIVEDVPSAYTNLPEDFVNRWRHPGDVTNVPGIPSVDVRYRRISLPEGNTESSYRMYNYSNIRVVSGDYLRCTNIGLNYIFPAQLIRRIGFSNLSLGFSVSNPFIIKNKSFHGLDPEVATGSQPLTRSYAFQLNLSL